MVSATNYNLTLNASNRMGPAFSGAAADAGDLTSVLRKQQQAAKDLNATQRDLGRYVQLKDNMAATSVQLRKTRVDLRGLASQQELSKARTTELAQEKRRLTRRLKALSEGMEAGGYHAATLDDEYQQLTKRAGALGAELDDERAKAKKLGKQFKATEKEAGGLSDRLAEQRGQLKKLGAGLTEAGVDTGKLAAEQKRLEAATAKSTAAIDRQKAALKKVGVAKGRATRADARMGELQSELVGTAAMVAGAVVPVSRAVTMEAAMADVSKVTNFEGTEKAEFQSRLQRLAVDVNIPPEQLTQIAAAAGQSGIDKKDLAGFTGAAARMGVAFDMEAAEAGETMAAWRAGMGLNQQQAETLADAVNHVSNNMNAKAKDISGVLKRQGAVATASGMTESQTASLAGALLSGGASEEVAATTLKNMLGALTKGDAATGGQKDAMAGLGLDASALAFDMQSDAVGTITQVFEALADAPVEQQSALISQLFGEESKGGIMPLLKNQQLLQKAFGLTADETAYAGSALAEYKNRAGVTEHRLGSAWRALDRLGIVLGDSLLPVVGPVADGVAWAAGSLADLAESGGAVTSVVTGLAASYVTYKAGALAWRMAQAKVEQWRAGSAVKTAEKEARLAAATDETADKADLAARAMDRLNDVLSRTARIRGGAASSDRRHQRPPRRNRAAERGALRPGSSPESAGRWGRVRSLAVRGSAAVAELVGGTVEASQAVDYARGNASGLDVDGVGSAAAETAAAVDSLSDSLSGLRRTADQGLPDESPQRGSGRRHQRPPRRNRAAERDALRPGNSPESAGRWGRVRSLAVRGTAAVTELAGGVVEAAQVVDHTRGNAPGLDVDGVGSAAAETASAVDGLSDSLSGLRRAAERGLPDESPGRERDHGHGHGGGRDRDGGRRRGRNRRRGRRRRSRGRDRDRAGNDDHDSSRDQGPDRDRPRGRWGRIKGLAAQGFSVVAGVAAGAASAAETVADHADTAGDLVDLVGGDAAALSTVSDLAGSVSDLGDGGAANVATAALSIFGLSDFAPVPAAENEPGAAAANSTAAEGLTEIVNSDAVSAVETVTDVVSAVSGAAAKVVRPIGMLLSGARLTDAVANGSATDAGAAVGDIGGGIAGAAAGAAIGTAILPVIGTAVGAIVGGYLGSEGGEWLGENVVALFRSDNAADSATQKELIATQQSAAEKQSVLAGADSPLQVIDQQVQQQAKQQSQSSTQQVSFAPVINVSAPAGANAEQVADLAMEKIQAMFNGSVLPALNPTLGGRLDDSMELMS